MIIKKKGSEVTSNCVSSEAIWNSVEFALNRGEYPTSASVVGLDGKVYFQKLKSSREVHYWTDIMHLIFIFHFGM